MRVLNYSHGADTGGVGHLIKRAFDRHSDWIYRQACRTVNYIGYPRDTTTNRTKPETFDVLHANNAFKTLPVMPSVIHYHGTQFRRQPDFFLPEQKRRKAVGLVSTLDLWLMDPPNLEWLPAPYDIEWLQTFRQPVGDGVFRVAHAPTDRGIKSTDPLIQAVDRLSKEIPVELVLVERANWQKCLARKGTADVYFDQVLLGYGNNAIEAWGMGIPVIAGGQPDTLAEMRNRFGDLPFYEATEETIYDALKVLADETTRAEWSRRGLAHVERFHDDAQVVAQLEPIYLRAVEQAG